MSGTLRKMRKQPNEDVAYWDLEPGHRIVRYGQVWDLYESNGRWKAAAGELSYRIAQTQKMGAKPVKIQDTWYWEKIQ